MTTYNVSISSKMANLTIDGTQVTAETEQEARKQANRQAAELAHRDHEHACDWKATITVD